MVEWNGGEFGRRLKKISTRVETREVIPEQAVAELRALINNFDKGQFSVEETLSQKNAGEESVRCDDHSLGLPTH